MGLVMGIGLSRIYNERDENWPRALMSLVESGVTDVVCDAITSPGADVRTAPVFRAMRVGGEVRGEWLSEADAAPIRNALAEVKELGGRVALSRDERALEDLGVSVQPLELVFDRPTGSRPDTVTLPGTGGATRLGDLSRSIRRWLDWDEMALLLVAMHIAAIDHRLILHSA